MNFLGEEKYTNPITMFGSEKRNYYECFTFPLIFFFTSTPSK